MYTRSENCPRRELCIQNGKGLVELKDLTDREGLYGHGRMFAHVTIRPGCSIGDHPVEHTLALEGVFNDNGKEVVVHAGDICATGYGEVHGMENRSDDVLEMIALIVME